MPDDAGRILSVRLRHPTEDRDLEVRLDSKKFSTVDAVFTSVDAVERILIPFYENVEHDLKKAADLRKAIQKQRHEDICVVVHRRSTSFMVPDIDWSSKSPIRL
jgi:hypothetical protein